MKKYFLGAITTHQGLQFLAHDPDTEVIVLISKPPAPQVVTGLVAAAQQINKPVIINFIGYPPPARQLGNVFFATTWAEAAELAIETKRLETERLEARQSLNLSVSQSPSFLRDLFYVGTLAYEAALGLQAVLSPLYSNVPITAEQKLADPLVSQGHTILDLGEYIFTQGRLHPMRTTICACAVCARKPPTQKPALSGWMWCWAKGHTPTRPTN